MADITNWDKADGTRPNTIQTGNAEEIYRALINLSPDGILISNLDGLISFASRTILEILELDTPEQLVGTSVLAWVEAEDEARLARDIDNAVRGSFATDSQYRFHTCSGKKFVGEINAALLHDAAGKATGFIANFQDITERWQAAEALQESEEKFRNMVQANPLGMLLYRLEPDGRLILEDTNPAGSHILRADIRALIGKTIEEAFPGLVETEVPTVYRRLAAEGGKWHKDQFDYDHGEIQGAYEIEAFQSAPGHMVAMFTDVTERKRAEQELRTSLERLQLLSKIDNAIIAHKDVQSTLTALVNLIADHFHPDSVEILFYDPEHATFQRIAGQGFLADAYNVPFNASEGIPGMVLQTARRVCMPDISALPNLNSLTFYTIEEINSGYSVPLITPDRVQGVLQLFFRKHTELTRATLESLELVANQVAIAIEKTSLWENHQDALKELVMAYATTLEGWVYALDLRDNETEHHTRRVTDLTVETARAMGIPTEKLPDIHRGALLHDIGKIGIPDSVLHKPGVLSEAEWAIMHQHPDFARQMLTPIPYLQEAIDIPYCHHERWDGSGYPRGLKGEEIPLAARIFAVVDVWDALTSDRPYRKAWSKDSVASYLWENSGKLFDPDAILVFFRLMGISG